MHPRSSDALLAGEWSARSGGRFNRKGRAALYLSLSPLTSLREIYRVGRLQPVLIVSFEADLRGIVDAAASAILRPEIVASDWRDQMRDLGQSESQALAESLIADGANGLLVRSFAPMAGPNDLNLVLWTWDPATLRVIDDERRLSP